MPRVTLHNEDGTLMIPGKDLTPEYARYYPDGTVLIYRYPEGGCDTVRWPRPKREHLESVLFDLRECGAIPRDAEVYLPNGKLVAF